MEFGSKNIARLVLGYLKEEKLTGAYEKMLLYSPHLQDMRRNEMKFYTRVNGMTLIDFLIEYETVYTIIQKHLECTDYFQKQGTRTPLTKQLQYLLTDSDALTSTPNDDSDRLEDANIFNEGEPNLGGQSYVTSSPQKASRSSDEQDEVNFDELLAQTFLNNSGLIEKLTESINKEVTDKSVEEVHNSTIGNEMNKNKINSIAQKFVENPAMVKVLHDMTRPSSQVGTVDTNGFEEFDGQNREPKGQLTPMKSKTSHSAESIKKRLRSNRKICPTPVEGAIIDEQNEDAIQSIIAASSTSDSSSHAPTQAELISNEVCSNVVLENPTFVTQPSTVNPLFYNAVMLQSNNNATSNFLTSNVLYFESNPEPAQFSLTNQELVNIPMIICDNQEVTNVQSSAVVPYVNSQPQNRLVKLRPKPDKPSPRGQMITIYRDDSCESKGKKASPNVKSKAKRKHSIAKQAPSSTEPPPSSTEPPKASVSFELPSSAAPSSSTSSEPINASKSRSLPPILTPKSTTGSSIEKKNRTTPRNGSHVRQLKFTNAEIVSPRHPVESPKSAKVLTSEQKTIKSKPPATSTLSDKQTLLSILEDNPTSNKADLISESTELVEKSPETENTPAVSLHPSWDADLRSMMSVTEPEKPTKRIRRKSSAKPNTKKKQSKVNLNDTEEDFELALDGIGIKPDDEVKFANLIDSTKSPIDNSKPLANLKEELIQDVSVTENSKTDEAVIIVSEVDNPAPENSKLNNLSESVKVEPSGKGINASKRRERLTKGAKKVINDEDNKVLSENVCSESETTINNLVLAEKQNLRLRTSNKSKIKNKCNIQNVTVNSFNSEEIVLTSITKIKSCKVIDDGHKLILSPSKLCPTKRNLESRSSDHKTEDRELLITPELSAMSSNMPLLGAKRDLLPLLETPMKSPSSMGCPITPGTYPVPNDQTPFTKAVLSQFNEIDISTIPTPSFPITPNFPFTPALENSPFPNRLTDYSTCSSYYQPSDTEQNKSIECLIKECKRLEDCKKLDECKSLVKDKESLKDAEKSWETYIKTDAIEKLENKQAASTSTRDLVVPKSVNKKSVPYVDGLIAKKDLRMMKSSNTSSSNSSSSSSSSSSGSSSDDTEEEEVVPPPHTNPYSLRARKPVTATVEAKREVRHTSRESNKSGTSKSQPANHKSELEAKRQRVINSVKGDNFKSKATPGKSILAAVLKNRRLSNKSNATPKRKKPAVRKSTSNSKAKKPNLTELKNKSNSEITAKAVVKRKSVQLHISSDEDDLEDTPMEITLLEMKPDQSSISVVNEKLEVAVDKSKTVDDTKDTTTVSEVDLKNATSKPVDTNNLPTASENSDMTNSEEFKLVELDNTVIMMTHDEQNKVKLKSPKTNREILKKQFSANIYIAPIDADMEILLTVTPMDFLFELPIKCESKRKSPRKPLNILSNRIIKPPNHLKSIENEIQTNLNEKQPSELNSVSSVESERKEGLNSTEMEHETALIDDGLMNYALVGSERIADGDELVSSDSRKRKRSELLVDKTVKKKKEVNSEEMLLKNVDLDSFLEQVHGNT